MKPQALVQVYRYSNRGTNDISNYDNYHNVEHIIFVLIAGSRFFEYFASGYRGFIFQKA
jgi:hypothetical protein